MQTPRSSRARLILGIFALALFSPSALGGPTPPREPVALGALPDFGPHSAVLTHTLIDGLETDLNRSLDRQLGARHVVEQWLPDDDEESGADPGTLVWMRDYVPIFVQREKGELVALQYLSEDPLRRAAFVADGEHLYVPTTRSGKGRWVKRETLPLIHENGNLVSTGRWFIVAETLFEDNRVELDDPVLRAAGYRPRNRVQVLDLLARAFRRDSGSFITLPPLPGEATGHVDTFVLALGPNTVLVPEIRSEALALTEDGVDFDLAVSVQWFLEEVVQTLETKGVTVLRAPMVAPRALQAADSDDPGVLDNVFFTPANTLAVQSGGEKHAFVPSFHRSPFLEPLERRLQRSYERELRTLLQARGYRVHAVRTETLARYLGLVRCVTAAVPEALAAPAPRPAAIPPIVAPKVRRRSAG